MMREKLDNALFLSIARSTIDKTAQENDLGAILAANTSPRTGGWALRKRFTFTIKRLSLKELLEELKEDRLSLKQVIKGIKARRKHTLFDPSDEARRLASSFQQVQASAVSLFVAMNEACHSYKCRDNHTIFMRLDSRTPPTEDSGRSRIASRRPGKEVIFHMAIPVMEQDFQEASVYARGGDADEDQTAAAVGEAKRINFAGLAQAGVPQITIQLDAARLQPPAQTRELVTDICGAAHTARLSSRVLVLDLVSGMLRVRSTTADAGGCRQFSSTTLETCLVEGMRDEDARLTPKQQTLIALDIASSILQLSQAGWLNKPFSSQRIKFAPRPSKARKHYYTCCSSRQPPDYQRRRRGAIYR
ncbi:hypothetical protein RB596_003031 [Gaeumannomyces avenae]